MKKLLLIMLLMAAMPAMSQYTGFYHVSGKVVDAETGKPLHSATVTNLRSSVQTDSNGSYTITYHTYDSDLRLYVSHQGYITDTFGAAPELVRLHSLPKSSIQTHNKQSRPTVAVVLSGGGAKGMAHISALRAIEDAGIPIDIVCGTSIGSLIGALYCVGYSTDQIETLVRSQDWTFLLSDRSDPSALSLTQRQEQNTYALIRGFSSSRPEQGGLIRGRNLNRLFRQLCAGYLDSISFDSLPIRFACVATDIVTNTEVDFRDGYLIRAMRASMAIPGVFTPVRMGDKVLIDGGLRNNYPADLARDMGADIIIGVTVQNAPLTADDIGDAASVLNQIIDVNCKNKYDENVAMSDVVIHVDVSGYSAASFSSTAIDTLIRRGAEEAARNRDDLLAVKACIDGSSKVAIPAHHTENLRPTPWQDRITSVDENTVQPIQTRKSARPKISQPTTPIVSAGFRFDSEEMGAIQLGAKLPINTSIPMKLQATLRLGRRIMGRLEYSAFTRRVFSPTLAYTFRHNDVDIYTLGVRTHNIKYRHHQGDFTPVDFQFHDFSIRAGMRWDYFNYYGNVLSSSGEPLDVVNAHYLSYRASAELNTEDQWYFPQHGMRFHASYFYRTDNLIGMGNEIGLNDLSAHWRTNITLLPGLTIQPMIYSRLLLGYEIPLAYRNAVGSEWFGQQVEQQMPFAGIGHLEYMERYFAAAQLQLHYRVLRNHYVIMRVSAAQHGDNAKDMFVLPTLFGAQIGYCYTTLFGPIDLRIGYSNRTETINVFLNIGHRF